MTETIDRAKIAKVDAYAFAEFKSIIELAFEADGYHGVLAMCKSAHEQAAVVADNSRARSLTGIAMDISTFMGAIWPGMQEAGIRNYVKKNKAPAPTATKTAAKRAIAKKVAKTAKI